LRFLVIDLEATCWQENSDISRMEIIEIGAVMLASETGPVESEFKSFIRPTQEPLLSDFCKRLTGIEQQWIDGAETFPFVLTQFTAWAGSAPCLFCSWGDYDRKQFEVEFLRHKLQRPDLFSRHINLKKSFAELKGIRPSGMKKALQLSGLPLEGAHHRAIDDAKNIARLAMLILPSLRLGKGNMDSV